jgi:deazaflavin-dependent oxidoreductase (nitroreductase family)
MPEYRRPGPMLAVANGFILVLNRLGVSPQGSHTLLVRGRSTGKQRAMPVNPLEFEGGRYLVAPRGDTHWARNLRANHEADLRLGRKTEHIRTEEVPEAERPQIIAAYLRRWGNVTREHFGASSNEPDAAEIQRLAARTPVFRVL